MDAADPTFPPEDATERAHRDDFKRDYPDWVSREVDHFITDDMWRRGGLA